MARTARGVGVEEEASRLSPRHVLDLVQGRIEKIDHAFDGVLHGGKSTHGLRPVRP